MIQHIDLGTIILVGLIAWTAYNKTVKDNTMELKKLVVMPVLFLYLMYSMLTKHFTLTSTDFVTIVVGMAIGTAIGFRVALNTAVRADREQNLICVVGSWLNLIIVLVVAAVKFGAGYIVASYPTISHGGIIRHTLFVLITAATSLMIGKSIAYYFNYVRAPSEHLELPEK